MQLEQKLQEISLQIEELSTTNIASLEEGDLYALIYLYCSRIHINLQLIHENATASKPFIKNDYDKIAQCVSLLDPDITSQKELLFCSTEIILLLAKEHREGLLGQLDPRTVNSYRKQSPLGSVVVSCAITIANICIYLEDSETLRNIVDNFISLSEVYNHNYPELHRTCVRLSLSCIADIDSALTCRLCDEQAKYFDGVSDYDTSRFLWLYGMTLQSVGRRDDAIARLKSCHEMCLAVEGENSWIGARSGHMYNCLLLNTNQSEQAESYLWNLIKRIDQAYYQDMDEHAQFTKMTALAALLSVHCQSQTLRYYPDELQFFCDFCYKNAGTIKNSFFTVRFAENLQGAYLLEKEEYLEATNHILNALHAEHPNDIEKKPTDLILYINLLQAYTYLNDEDQIRHYSALVVEGAKDDSLDYATIVRCNLVLKFAYQRFNVNTYKKSNNSCIHEYYEDIQNNKIPLYPNLQKNIVYSQSVLDQLDSILRYGSCSSEELSQIIYIINYFLDNPQIYPFIDSQNAINYSILAFAQVKMGDCNAVTSILRSLDYSKTFSNTNESKITNLCFAAALLYRFGELGKGKAILSDVLSCISESWKKAVIYVDDKRLSQALGIVQKQFGSCYSQLRTSIASNDVYESVLMFKDLSALAGRERNRILRLAPVDEELRFQLFALQDQLADAELKDSLTGSNTRQQIVAELQKLEATFAEKFPKNNEFTEISFERVCASLSNNSAILEYHFAVTTPSDSNFRKTQIELDLFVVAKHAGSVQFKHIVIPNGLEVIENAEAYVNALQNPEDITYGAQKNTLPCWLYNSIVKPAIPYLSNIDTVYIAPDDQLSNLPFEILHAENGPLLQDVYTVCRIVCGRDLLFEVDGAKENNCFVLGDPNYEASQGKTVVSNNRRMGSSLTPVFSLPFSGVEADKVSRKLGVQSFTGDAATKYALQHALPCRIIHLATHGVFDEELNTDALYSSHLVFAGYNKWVTNAEESLLCGNGILTADEISRMDLHQTELVVLSACQSGIVGINNRSVHGLVSAFAAAGVHWVICHMWEAADFTTPILMDAFYEAYLYQGKDVPEALQYAKDYLRNVTIGELRQAGWLDDPSDSRIQESTKKYLQVMRKANDRRRPFTDEYYWGGFTVHKTR